MWEIALLIIAVAFLLLVIFAIPVLLQVKDSAKELEFALKEFRETLTRVNVVVDEIDQSVKTGSKTLRKLDRTLEAVEQTFGTSTFKVVSKPLTGILEAMPVILSASKIYRKYIKRR